MMRLKTALLLGTLVLSVNGAQAVISPAQQMTTAEVPQAHFSRSTDGSTVDNLGSRLLLGVSSWQPQSIRLRTYRDQATTLSRDGFPLSFVNYEFPIGSYSRGDLTGLMGFGFVSMRRSEISGNSQNVALFTSLIGIEFSPRVFHWPFGYVHFGFGLLPTMASASRSSVSDAESAVAFPGEFSTGMFIGKVTGVDLSLSHNIGRSEVIVADGLALRAAVKFEL